MSARTDIVNPPVLQRGKAAYRASVAACGGQDGTAATTGKGQQRISLYGHPNSDAFPPLDAIVAQEAVTHGTPGHPHVTRFLAREAGFELFRLPSAGLPETVWSRHMGGVLKEVGDVVERLGVALSDDNDVSGREAKPLIDECNDAIAKFVELRAALVARAGGES